MGEIVNLNRFRKRAARAEADTKASANRAKYGRSRTERLRDEAQARRDDTHLDQHRLSREDEP